MNPFTSVAPMQPLVAFSTPAYPSLATPLCIPSTPTEANFKRVRDSRRRSAYYLMPKGSTLTLKEIVDALKGSKRRFSKALVLTSDTDYCLPSGDTVPAGCMVIMLEGVDSITVFQWTELQTKFQGSKLIFKTSCTDTHKWQWAGNSLSPCANTVSLLDSLEASKTAKPPAEAKATEPKAPKAKAPKPAKGQPVKTAPSVPAKKAKSPSAPRRAMSPLQLTRPAKFTRTPPKEVVAPFPSSSGRGEEAAALSTVLAPLAALSIQREPLLSPPVVLAPLASLSIQREPLLSPPAVLAPLAPLGISQEPPLLPQAAPTVVECDYPWLYLFLKSGIPTDSEMRHVIQRVGCCWPQAEACTALMQSLPVVNILHAALSLEKLVFTSPSDWLFGVFFNGECGLPVFNPALEGNILFQSLPLSDGQRAAIHDLCATREQALKREFPIDLFSYSWMAAVTLANELLGGPKTGDAFQYIMDAIWQDALPLICWWEKLSAFVLENSPPACLVESGYLYSATAFHVLKPPPLESLVVDGVKKAVTRMQTLRTQAESVLFKLGLHPGECHALTLFHRMARTMDVAGPCLSGYYDDLRFFLPDRECDPAGFIQHFSGGRA